MATGSVPLGSSSSRNPRTHKNAWVAWRWFVTRQAVSGKIPEMQNFKEITVYKHPIYHTSHIINNKHKITESSSPNLHSHFLSLFSRYIFSLAKPSLKPPLVYCGFPKTWTHNHAISKSTSNHHANSYFVLTIIIQLTYYFTAWLSYKTRTQVLSHN